LGEPTKITSFFVDTPDDGDKDTIVRLLNQQKGQTLFHCRVHFPYEKMCRNSFKMQLVALVLLLLLLLLSSSNEFCFLYTAASNSITVVAAFTVRTMRPPITTRRTRARILPPSNNNNKIWTIPGSSSSSSSSGILHFSFLSTERSKPENDPQVVLAAPSSSTLPLHVFAATTAASASSSSVTTTTTSPESGEEDKSDLQKRRPTRRRSMILLGACALVAVGFWIVSPTAAAAATTTNSPFLIPVIARLRMLRQHQKILRRAIFATIFLKLAVYDRIQLRRRQAIDLTSEWSRYSQHPGARGRALVHLIGFQVLPLFLFSRLLRVLERRKGKDMDDDSEHDDDEGENSSWRNRLLTHSGRVLADGLLALGPLYIKLGQILSSRPALLPKQWIPALERLQDQVPAKSGMAAFGLAHAAWPGGQASFEATFYDFDATPLAAASLGQVHRAVLRSSNETVAIKLQRPFLRRIYNQDLGLMTQIAVLVDRYGGKVGQVGGIQQSWTNIFRDAEEILYREIDYRAEAENGMRFCQDFGLDKHGKARLPTAISRDGQVLPSAAPWLRAPYVYDHLSSEKVLVMEYVPSIKITKTSQLYAANVTAAEREYLADCLARAYLRQFCSHYFFSTDPHPGNVGCEILQPREQQSLTTDVDPSSRVRLVFYDFGQAATLTRNQADGILEIIQAIVEMNVDASIASFQKMGVLSDSVDLDKVRAKVADNYKTGKVKANRKKLKKSGYKVAASSSSSSSSSSVSSSILINGEKEHGSSSSSSSSSQESTLSTSSSSSDSEIMSYFVLPAQYAFVGRALAQMDGVGKSLDAEFDFISSAAPWIYEVKGASRYLQEEVYKWIDHAKDTFRKHINVIAHGINRLSHYDVDDKNNAKAAAVVVVVEKTKDKAEERSARGL
jgi:predicted unusual protein kinase regulating ubiquinone biosynthesis (AarF/ABC1/UbiB family)